MGVYQVRILNAIYGCEKIKKPATFRDLRFALGIRPRELLNTLREMEMKCYVETDYGLYGKIYKLSPMAFQDED